jgi:hypothetical protein
MTRNCEIYALRDDVRPFLNGRRHRAFDSASETVTVQPGASAITLHASF